MLLIFLFVGPTSLGIVIAYVLDRDIRGARFYQSMFLPRSCFPSPWLASCGRASFTRPTPDLPPSCSATANQSTGSAIRRFLIPIGSNYGLSKNFAAILIAIAWRHTGYIMVLYLAGLKSVDSSLREAAMLDGSNEWQVFRNVVFPSLKPINVVVAVITVIEALRAFDIILCSTRHERPKCFRS